MLKVKPEADLKVGIFFWASDSRNWYSKNCCSPPLLDEVRIWDSCVQPVIDRAEPAPPPDG